MPEQEKTLLNYRDPAIFCNIYLGDDPVVSAQRETLDNALRSTLAAFQAKLAQIAALNADKQVTLVVCSMHGPDYMTEHRRTKFCVFLHRRSAPQDTPLTPAAVPPVTRPVLCSTGSGAEQ